MTPLDYFKLGFTLIPWMPKHAATYIKDFKLEEVTNSEEQILQWCRAWPQADWAIVPRGCVVFDLENKHGLDGKADLTRLFAANGGLSFEEGTKGCPVASTRNNGLHVWYRINEGCNFRGQLHIQPGVEVKHRNGQVHVPPSENYTWLNPICAVSEMPLLPDWLYETWRAATQKSKDCPEEEFKTLTNGNRHIGLNYFASKLRGIGLGEEEIKDALLSVRRMRCESPDEVDDKEIGRLASHYAKKEGGDVIYKALNGDEDSRRVIEYIIGNKIPATVKTEEPVKQEDDSDRCPLLDFNTTFDPAPAELPLLSNWVNWSTKTNNKPQPTLACAALLTLVSTIAGRYYSWRRARPNIYCLGLADTGQGKEWVLNSSRELVIKSGFKDMLGDKRFTSSKGVTHELQLSPTIIWIQDEISSWIENLSSLHCQTYLKEVVDVLLQVYSSYAYEESSLSGKDRIEIPNVYASWYATGQITTFKSCFNLKLLYNGFFNRLLYFMPDHVYEDPNEIMCDESKNYDIPQYMVDMLLKFRSDSDTLIMRRAGLDLNKQVELPMTDDLRPAYIDLVNSTNLIDKWAVAHNDGIVKFIVPRRNLNIIKVAMLYAILQNPEDPHMSAAGFTWARTLVDSSIANLYRLVSRSTSATATGDRHETNSIAVLNYIEVNRGRGRTSSEIMRKFRLKAKDMDDILRTLIEAKDVVHHELKGKTGRTCHKFASSAYTFQPEDGILLCNENLPPHEKIEIP